MGLTTPLLLYLSVGLGTGSAISRPQNVAAVAAATTATEPAGPLRVRESIDGIPSDLHSTYAAMQIGASVDGTTTFQPPKSALTKQGHVTVTHPDAMTDMKKRHLVARTLKQGKPVTVVGNRVVGEDTSTNLMSPTIRAKLWASRECGGAGAGCSAGGPRLEPSASEKAAYHSALVADQEMTGRTMRAVMAEMRGRVLRSDAIPSVAPQPLRADAYAGVH